MREYTIILDPDVEDGGYTVTVPLLPGCITQGDTVEECVDRAKEAIELYLESLAGRGQPIPEEVTHPLAIVVSVAA